MFWSIILPLIIMFITPVRNSLFRPETAKCVRRFGNVWLERWGHSFSRDMCEVLDNIEGNEECGVCGRPCYTCLYAGYPAASCWHYSLGWLYDFKESHKCIKMDHCKYSYQFQIHKLNFSTIEVCGDKNGKCKSVYGSYTCECKPGFQGRDCTDRGPKGTFASGVVVLLDQSVKVSEEITVLVAVKERGNRFKLSIYARRFNFWINATEPEITKATVKELVPYCSTKTRIKHNDCKTYLTGMTEMYMVSLKFPVLREGSVWYYLEHNQDFPIGYYSDLEIFTTNLVNGVERVSFNRTHYQLSYNVFVEYPIYIGCYKSFKIQNCAEAFNKARKYAAAEGITLHVKDETGDFNFHEEITIYHPECYRDGNDTSKWTLFRVTPKGQFEAVYEQIAEVPSPFTIKPYSLQTGIYFVEFKYRMINDARINENFDQCFLDVQEEPIVAIIAGGKSRYVDVDTVIIFDGSSSYDPNLKGLESKIGLMFKWSCTIKKEMTPCLEDYLPPSFSSLNIIKLPASVLEKHREFVINLRVTKVGKATVETKQFLVTGKDQGNILSIGIICINCIANIFANPTDYIYLLVQVDLKPNLEIKYSNNFTWTFSADPVYPPENSTSDIRVNETSQELLKIEKNKLKYKTIYWFRAAVTGAEFIYAEVDIHIPFMKRLECDLKPESGIVAVTNFSINCSISTELTYEVYDKSPTDLKYFSGRMLFTDLPRNHSFTLSNNNFVVYAYNEFKMIQEWTRDVKLQEFNGTVNYVYDLMQRLKSIEGYPQRLLHSASIIPVPVTHEMDWPLILKTLISTVSSVAVDKDNFKMIKLVLSSIEYILSVLSKKTIKFTLEVGEAKTCADIIFALVSSLSEIVHFFSQRTLTETIFHQMIRSNLNVIEIVLTVRNPNISSKPLHLVNPLLLHLVKETSYKFVEALYIMSKNLLWRQIQGDSATEIVSVGSKIRMWARVHRPEVLYHMRSQNDVIPFNFSRGYYKTIKDIDTLGIQVTTLNINPFWWAGGDIDTNVLLVDFCFKVNLTACKNQRAFLRAPIFLYYNISKNVNLINPLNLYTVYLNFSKHVIDLDLGVTVYRFDPPLRAKLIIDIEFENSDEEYKVLFEVNKRPTYEMMQDNGITVNKKNQSEIQYPMYKRDENDKLYFMGIIPVNEGDAEMKSKFKLKIFYVNCKTWLKWKWGSQRCWVGEKETNERTLRCDCNHLSIFGATVQVPLYKLNPAMEFLLFLTQEFNWVPLTVLLIILILFILLYIWGWWQDKKDSKKGIVIILEDNYPGEKFGYLLGVYTGSRINSSTDANVGVKLIGEHGSSRAHILKSSTQQTLQGNSDDWFIIYSSEHLGILIGLQIWHDNTGKSPDWFVEKIDVFDLTDKFEYIFELNIWLALQVDEYPDAYVTTSSIDEFYSVRRVFLSNVVTGFRDTNYWTSILWKHARNPIQRAHRISVVLCYTMVAFCFTVLVYKLNKGLEYREDEPSYDLDLSDLIIFAITLLVASFTSCLVMFLFRKSFYHRYVRTQSSLFLRPEDTRRSTYFSPKQNDDAPQVKGVLSNLSLVSMADSTLPQYLQLSNKDLDYKFIQFGLQGKMLRERSIYEKFANALHSIVQGSSLEPVRLPKTKKSLIIKRILFVPAWSLCIAIFIVTAVIVIMFGHQIPKVYSEKWLTVFLCALLFDALVLSTIKIILCSTILACAFQRIVPASNYQLHARDGIQKKLVGDVDHLFKLAQMRSHPMYCPLTDRIKELYRLQRIRVYHWRLLIDFCVVFLLVLVLGMITTIKILNLYNSNNQSLLVLTQNHSPQYRNFSSIFNRTHYQNFLLQNFMDQLHRYLWYNQVDPLNDIDEWKTNSWTYDCTTRLLGNARIRQLRVRMGDCAEVKYFENMKEYCSPAWSSSAEDTSTYGSRWHVGGYEDVTRKSTAWRYTDAAHSNSSATYGPTLNYYPSGGYIENLGSDKDDVEDVLTDLFTQHWFDHLTRAVFIELTLYNVNTRLFSGVVLVAEQMPTGDVLVSAKAVSVTTEFSFNFWNVSFVVFFLFFMVRMCILMNRNGIFVYLSRLLSVFEVCFLALVFVTVIVYVIHTKTSSEYVQEFHSRGFYEFFSFSNMDAYRVTSTTILSILFACSVIRLLISWRFGRIYVTFYYTVFLSLPWIVWLVLYFILYLVIIWRFVGYFLNLFVFPFYTSVIIYYKNFFVILDESFEFKVLMYSMCLFSYIVILLFISSFTYYYKVAKFYKLIDTDMFNICVFLTEVVTNIAKKCIKRK